MGTLGDLFQCFAISMQCWRRRRLPRRLSPEKSRPELSRTIERFSEMNMLGFAATMLCHQ